MSKIKDDLVCEVIRVSQTNLLGKKKADCNEKSGNDVVVDWIRRNAANYREDLKERLSSYSSEELGDMLSELTRSKKDLSEILGNYTSLNTNPKRSNQ